MRKVYCDYCGRETEYVDSKVIYGKSYGKIYLCRNCMAYVGVHKGTDKPLGRLANAELRNWKKAAHAVFDPLWKYGRFRGHRNAAYAWLAQKMGLPLSLIHISHDRAHTHARTRGIAMVCSDDFKEKFACDTIYTCIDMVKSSQKSL